MPPRAPMQETDISAQGLLRSPRCSGHGLESPVPQERNFAEVLDGAKDHGDDDDYEDPESHVAEAWQSMKILPARPINESEYADTRYFKGATDAPLSLDAKTSISLEGQTWNMRMRLEEVDKPTYKDIRSQHVKVPYHRMKSEAFHLSRNQSTPEIPLALASSSFMTSNHSMQNRDHKESMQSHSPKRCQSPASYGPRENLLHHKNTSWRKPFPARSDEKDVQHNEWYIGEYSRQAVEEALMKENKDGTFLVRDCSTKSRAEPYVLVVFYGKKVYNVKIRFLERNQQFALGTGLRGDEKFDSVEDIIEHYKYFPIILVDGKDKTGIHREQCYLTRPLPLNRHFSAW
ncbi:hypothetical protein HPG69_001646 [Diceros bicornis minor]|uniref:SH2 domain-containing protein n=1 Tax=Diceros bicornis minor TaxID=77932 RepID=A0A7J7FG28_DICBM|nr:hypothetical protein HPG69_001646 [Diceros bicornis minor]